MSAFQSQDSPIQHISIRPAHGARAIGINRHAKTTDDYDKLNIQDNSKITVIHKSIDTPKIPWKYVNKRKPKFHPAIGAYPVYYAIARANGSFQGNRIRTLKSDCI